MGGGGWGDGGEAGRGGEEGEGGAVVKKLRPALCRKKEAKGKQAAASGFHLAKLQDDPRNCGIDRVVRFALFEAKKSKFGLFSRGFF